MRLATTKLAKQLSAYALIDNDLTFCARAFALAAQTTVRTPQEKAESRPIAQEQMNQLWQAEPLLRHGATVANFDAEDRTDQEVSKAALFEAAVVTYGRCFNTGARTSLQTKIFTEDLLGQRTLHEHLLNIRNTHVAHTELREERSIVGFRLVVDQNYGKRPNMVMGITYGRRYYPDDSRLSEFAAHCNAVREKYLRPKLLEATKAFREQILAMPTEQIEQMPPFSTANPPQGDLC